MHKIYIEQGKYNFIYNIPQILYSTIISTVLLILIKYLALSENNIIEFKQSKVSNILFDKLEKLLKFIFIKSILFFSLSFILLMIFWYYLISFCSIYKNTQIHLIKDTIMSFVLSLLYPSVLYLIPGIFRIKALNDKKKSSSSLYYLSKIIQML